MHIVLGASGHVGSAVAKTLLAAGEPVTAVLHDPANSEDWRDAGATVAVVDVHDPEALRDVLRTGRRAFLLNPPADVAGDTDAGEHRTIAAITDALDGSDLEKVVVESTYGAQPGEALGDLSVLYDFEQLVAASGIPAAINRAAYYMSNWDMLLPAAREGKLPTMYPRDLAIPMVAPADLGAAAARRMLSSLEDVGVRYVEGPRRYSSADVAAAFAVALARDVAVEVVPRETWEATYRKQGFSAAAARAYTRMTEVSVDGGFDTPDDPERGRTTLEAYIGALVANG